MGPLLAWWLVVLLMGWAALPLTFLTLKHLPDKGYAFSKILALIFLGYVGWIFGHFTFGPIIPYLALFLLLVTGLLLWNRSGHALRDFLKEHFGYVLVVEALFLAAFLVAGSFKNITPDITGTEKPMDFAMINGILNSLKMPPQDPWLSGGSISYYYFGYFVVASLIKLTGVAPSVGYNLAVALIWALSAVAAFGLGYALTRRFRYAGFSCASVTVLGNLDYWHRAFQSFKVGDLRAPYYNFTADPNALKGLPGFFGFLFNPLAHYWDYFQASRIVPVPPSDKLINEFPAFSFFLADLHPHVMAIPFVLFAMAICYNILKAPLPGLEVFGGRRPWQVSQWILVSVVFGCLGFLNSWDYPTLMLLLGLSLLLQQLWTGAKDQPHWFKRLALIGLPLVAATFIFFTPFYLRFQSQAKGLGLVRDRTDLYYLGVLFGLFLWIALPVLVGRALAAVHEKAGRMKAKKSDELQCVICGQEGSGKKFCGNCGGELAPPVDVEVTPIPDEGFRNGLKSAGAWLSDPGNSARGWTVLLGAFLVLGLLNLGHLELSVLLGGLILVFLAALSFSSKNDSKEMVFATLLAAIAGLLLTGCEVGYIRDHFAGGELYRMNSVFKFHYQVWLLLSIASAPFLKWLLEVQFPVWASWKRIGWASVALLALLGSSLYPVLTVEARMRSAGGTKTLDGLAAFKAADPGDFEAAQFIRDEIKPVDGRIPVILESWGGSYSQFARIATQTGYPTVLGWDFHEAQWRGSWDQAAIRGGSSDDTVMHRRNDVDTIYSSTDLNQAKDLLKKYGVDYVVVGNLERQGTPPNKAAYPPDGLVKFDQLGQKVFDRFGTAIYKVHP